MEYSRSDPETASADHLEQAFAGVATVTAWVPAPGLKPKIPEDRLLSFVVEGLRPVDGGFRMKLDPGTYEVWEPGDLRLALLKIACPTLVLRGSESIVTSIEGVAALADGLPNREVQEIRGSSHMLLLEQPEVVAQTLRDFMRRHLTTAA